MTWLAVAGGIIAAGVAIFAAEILIIGAIVLFKAWRDYKRSKQIKAKVAELKERFDAEWGDHLNDR